MPPDPRSLLAEIEALKAEVSSLKTKNTMLTGLLGSIRLISVLALGAEVAVAQEEEESDESSSDDEVEITEPDSPPQTPVDDDSPSSEEPSSIDSSSEDDDDDDDLAIVASVPDAADNDSDEDSDEDSEDSSSDDSDDDDDASDVEVDLVLSRRPPDSDESDELDSPDDDDETPSPNQSARRPPQTSSDLDISPNEILSEILRHLHQPFHFSNYANALLGITDSRPDSKLWNPVGLQLVSRRFRAIAQPLFYHQVAPDAGNETVADILYDLDSKSPLECDPFRHTKSILWVSPSSRSCFGVLNLLYDRAFGLEELVVKDSDFVAYHRVKRTLVLSQDSTTRTLRN